ncbi:acyl-CoA dehydrogenase family protein [Streptomyces sp. NPDC002851]
MSSPSAPLSDTSQPESRSSDVPHSAGGLLDRVRGLRPLLREHALRAERAGRMTPEMVAALAESGVTKMSVPLRYGGYQMDLRTQFQALSEISTACGATGFVTAIQSGAAYVAALFPDAAQDEIFKTSDVRISGSLVPGGKAVPRDGGYVVNGRSPFATGCRNSDWHLMTAVLDHTGPGDGPPRGLWHAIPTSELEIVDDWKVSGLSGTGSNSVVAKDVFVPAHRVMPVDDFLAGSSPSVNAEDPFYRVPVVLLFVTLLAPNALGMARSSLAEFRDRSHRRGITYTFYERQNEAAATHLQVAEAAMKLNCAELLTADLVHLLESRAASASPYTSEERARVHGQSGYVLRLCKEAAEILASASGASSLHLDVPIQRNLRDLHALNLHAFVAPATKLELYGRLLSGLDANTPFL